MQKWSADGHRLTQMKLLKNEECFSVGAHAESSTDKLTTPISNQLQPSVLSAFISVYLRTQFFPLLRALCVLCGKTNSAHAENLGIVG